MKKTVLRTIAFLLITALLCGFVCSCSNKYYKEIPQTDEEKRVVMTVGDHEVTYDFFRAVFLSYNDRNSVTDTESFDNAMNTVIEFFAYFYSVFDMCADEGISVKSNEIMNRVDDVVAASIDGGTAEGVKYDAIGSFEKYKEALAGRNMNDFVNRKMILQSILENDLTKKHVDVSSDIDDDVLKDYFDSDEYIHITWLMTEYEDVAEKVYNDLLSYSGSESDFPAYITRKFVISTIAVSAKSIEDGWYIGKHETGFSLDNIFDCAASLKVGEFSSVIKQPDGYFYIIYRLEKDPSYLENSKNNVKKSYFNSEFYKKLEKYENSLKENINYKELYNELRGNPDLL